MSIVPPIRDPHPAIRDIVSGRVLQAVHAEARKHSAQKGRSDPMPFESTYSENLIRWAGRVKAAGIRPDLGDPENAERLTALLVLVACESWESLALELAVLIPPTAAEMRVTVGGRQDEWEDGYAAWHHVVETTARKLLGMLDAPAAAKSAAKLRDLLDAPPPPVASRPRLRDANKGGRRG
jgi:hypothetical protein